MDKRCGRCGKDPASGFAMVDDVRYCHGADDWMPGDPVEVTCYEIAQRGEPSLPSLCAVNTYSREQIV